MRKRDRKELCRYIRWVANEMCLRDWTFDVPHEPLPESDAFATVKPTDGRKRARITFCRDFRDLEPDRQRHVVIHELVHCHFAMVQHQIESDLERHLGQHADRVLFDSFRRNLEYGVDGITDALAPHLPLIRWPE